MEDPGREAVGHAMNVTHHADAPILAAAVAARGDYLITWNTRHFHKKPVQEFVSFHIVTPGGISCRFSSRAVRRIVGIQQSSRMKMGGRKH